MSTAVFSNVDLIPDLASIPKVVLMVSGRFAEMEQESEEQEDISEDPRNRARSRITQTVLAFEVTILWSSGHVLIARCPVQE